MSKTPRPVIDIERTSRMTGKSIAEIAKADLDTSNFDEYFTSRFWGSSSVYKWMILMIPGVKALYKGVYDSYREENGRTLNFAQ